MTTKQLAKLAKSLKLEFKDSHLITNAFVHKSYLNEAKDFSESNERLEYLGDAVLELITSEFLFMKYPEYQEGMLTNLRASLVKTTTLADLSLRLGFDKLILMSKGEEETGGRSNQSILANITESFLGALYIDQGYESCKQVLDEHLFPQIEEVIKSNSYKDSKSLLQEVAQAKMKETPIYELISAKGPDHDKEFIMQVIIANIKYATGSGKSKQHAQEDAARATLEMIDNT